MDSQHDPQSESGALWDGVDADEVDGKPAPKREPGVLMRRGRDREPPRTPPRKDEPVGQSDTTPPAPSADTAKPAPAPPPTSETTNREHDAQVERQPPADAFAPATGDAAPAGDAAAKPPPPAEKPAASTKPAAREAPPKRPHTDTPAVQLIDIHKSFGPLCVLDGVGIAFEAGRTTVVIGPSGTGKSVLLKHIVGLERPDRGEVWFQGKRLDSMSDRELVDARMKMGFLFQMGALFDSMSVADNIRFPLLEHAKMSAAEREERCRKVLAMVGLPDAAKKMPADLSGGQRKRVALARAIVLEPDLVLYDEPTTGLDPITADLINELIITLNQNMGITSIVVTHDMASARKVAHRIVMLHGGKVLADADTESFLNCDNELVQRFIKGEADAEDLQRIRDGFE
jgi:phospholipid/cholesterol/gamma-HCH transport system ATP-binding protein